MLSNGRFVEHVWRLSCMEFMMVLCAVAEVGRGRSLVCDVTGDVVDQ